MTKETRVVTVYSSKYDGIVFVTTTAKTDEEAIDQLVTELNSTEQWCKVITHPDPYGDGEDLVLIVSDDFEPAPHMDTDRLYHVVVGVVQPSGFCPGAVQW